MNHSVRSEETDGKGRKKQEPDKRLEEIGRRVRKAREAMGISREEFAGSVGASKTALQNFEGGKTDPRISTLIRIALGLKKPADFLLFGPPDNPLPLIREKLSRQKILHSVLKCQITGQIPAANITKIIQELEQLDDETIGLLDWPYSMDIKRSRELLERYGLPGNLYEQQPWNKGITK